MSDDTTSTSPGLVTFTAIIIVAVITAIAMWHTANGQDTGGGREGAVLSAVELETVSSGQVAAYTTDGTETGDLTERIAQVIEVPATITDITDAREALAEEVARPVAIIHPAGVGANHARTVWQWWASADGEVAAAAGDVLSVEEAQHAARAWLDGFDGGVIVVVPLQPSQALPPSRTKPPRTTACEREGHRDRGTGTPGRRERGVTGPWRRCRADP